MDLEWLLDFLNGMVKPGLALVVLLIATLIILEDARSGGGNGLFGFQVETALALGATMTQATLQQVKRALVIAISPVLNSTKTVGLITVLGAMTGLIMGGASPLEASHIQIVIMIMLLGSATVSCIMSTYLCRPAFLSKAYQLEVEVYSPD